MLGDLVLSLQRRIGLADSRRPWRSAAVVPLEYGQVFVGGSAISLVHPTRATLGRQVVRDSAREKRSTPPKEKVNAPPHKRSTLININLKKEIEEEEKFVSSLRNGFLGRHRDPDMQRIALKAAQMVENAICQAA